MLMVVTAMARTAMPAWAKIHQGKVARKANSRSQRCRASLAMGAAMRRAMPMSCANSLFNSMMILAMPAPRTLRMLISFFLFSTIYRMRPSRPMQEINMVIAVAACTNQESCVSL
jgi:hypothetical protein